MLIFISLMQSYQLGGNIDSPYVVLLQVFSSVLVLCYALSIEKNNYSSRAERLYSCASVLAKLKVEMTPYLNKEAPQSDQPNYLHDKYLEFHKKYDQTLSRYEMEAVDDFRVDYLKAKLQMPEDYSYTKKEKIVEYMRVWKGSTTNFAHYYIILIAVISILYWLAKPVLPEKTTQTAVNICHQVTSHTELNEKNR